jgi:hypothetical protein
VLPTAPPQRYVRGLRQQVVRGERPAQRPCPRRCRTGAFAHRLLLADTSKPPRRAKVGCAAELLVCIGCTAGTGFRTRARHHTRPFSACSGAAGLKVVCGPWCLKTRGVCEQRLNVHASVHTCMHLHIVHTHLNTYTHTYLQAGCMKTRSVCKQRCVFLCLSSTSTQTHTSLSPLPRECREREMERERWGEREMGRERERWRERERESERWSITWEARRRERARELRGEGMRGAGERREGRALLSTREQKCLRTRLIRVLTSYMHMHSIHTCMNTYTHMHTYKHSYIIHICTCTYIPACVHAYTNSSCMHSFIQLLVVINRAFLFPSVFFPFFFCFIRELNPLHGGKQKALIITTGVHGLI